MAMFAVVAMTMHFANIWSVIGFGLSASCPARGVAAKIVLMRRRGRCRVLAALLPELDARGGFVIVFSAAAVQMGQPSLSRGLIHVTQQWNVGVAQA
jgi:hypothetical protein